MARTAGQIKQRGPDRFLVSIFIGSEVVDGKRIDCPPLRQTNRTFKQPPRAETPEGEQGSFNSN